eukprot:gene12227-16377_t
MWELVSYLRKLSEVILILLTIYRLHHDILLGNILPNKQLISVAVEAGLADRLTGIVSSFYYALLSNRAFRMLSYGSLPSFSSACDSPYINWDIKNYSNEFSEDVIAPLKYTYKGVFGYTGDRSYNQSLVDTNLYWPMYLTGMGDTATKMMVESNLSVYPQNKSHVPYIITSSNRGRSYRLFKENTFHKQELVQKYGFVNENACFMCTFHYLFRPNKHVKSRFQSMWDILSDKSLFKIGIQIRTGDHVFHQQHHDSSINNMKVENILSQYSSYFKCAIEIEKEYQLTYQKVVWYVISESKILKSAISNYYGDKVITDKTTLLKHIHCETNSLLKQDCDSNSMDPSMQIAFGELFTFSLMNFHVITRDSGFGRLGAWASLQPNHSRYHIYNIAHNEERKCGKLDYDDPYLDAVKYSGAGV